MSNDIVIRAEGVGKRYRIGTRQKYKALRDSLAAAVVAPFRAACRLLKPGGNATPDEGVFWALKDVDFEVSRGEVVGIIGRNGAGKSTLLKILSRITEPTEGRIELAGRVGSLLEVGTGFHPELTGRENIFLNGAILGMKRVEILNKFDEIVEFAEIERFLDTPVKHFSSGMYMRLAFAVAAHLEPEILLVDEVLAVGDVAFQKKCLGKMSAVSREGRTVLFVSHNMAAVESLCRTAVVLGNGRVVFKGVSPDAIAHYLDHSHGRAAVPLGERRDRSGNGRLRFVDFELKDAQGRPVGSFASGEEAVLVLELRGETSLHGKAVEVSIGIDDARGNRVAYIGSQILNKPFRLHGRETCLELRIPRLPLVVGTYSCTLFCQLAGDISDWVVDALQFDVTCGDFYGTGRIPSATQGSFLLDYDIQLRTNS